MEQDDVREPGRAVPARAAFRPSTAERGRGRIIRLASQQSVRAFGASGAYGVSNAAVSAPVRSQAEAWSRHVVCVNALAPGFVRTPLTRAVFDDPVGTEAMVARTMAGRNGEPADPTGAAVFLASDAARCMKGRTLFVDVGLSVT